MYFISSESDLRVLRALDKHRLKKKIIFSTTEMKKCFPQHSLHVPDFAYFLFPAFDVKLSCSSAQFGFIYLVTYIQLFISTLIFQTQFRNKHNTKDDTETACNRTLLL